MNIQTECSSNFIPHAAFADLCRVVQGLSKDSLLQVSALWLEILRFNGPAPFEMLDRLKCCAFLFLCSVDLTSRLKGLTVPQ